MHIVQQCGFKMAVLVIQMFFSKWEDEGEVDLKEQLEQLIVNTASRCLLGQEIRNSHLEKVTSLFHDLDNGMLPISVMFPYLPIPAHNRRDRLVIVVLIALFLVVFLKWIHLL